MDTQINIIDSLKGFLLKNHDQKSPLLLALSGGSDSMALFHALKEFKKDFLHIAHVDHGWREESVLEANLLSNLAKLNGIPFHLMRLTDLPEVNKEDFSRQKRLEFYQSLCDKYSYQAVLLGHHQDDLLETVLKRVFEGASLQKLYGMEKVSKYKNLALWRPLLDISKQTLVNFLEEKEITWYEDRTNQDTKYLRARMRKEMIPYLQETFGKEFSNNLLLLSKRSLDLRESLEGKFQVLLSKKKEGPLGTYFDLTILEALSVFEKQHFFTLLFRSIGLPIRRKVLDTVISWSMNCKLEKKIFLHGVTIIIGRQKIFFLKQSLLTFPKLLKLPIMPETRKNSEMHFREAKVKVGSNTWEDLWKGSSNISLPIGEYELCLLNKGEEKSLMKWWSMKKVPVFLRSLFPVIKKNGKVVADFLSGYQALEKKMGDEPYYFKLELQPQVQYNKLADNCES